MSNPNATPPAASSASATSRRKFLQGAAIATAAVAATGAAGAAIAEACHTPLPPIIQTFGSSHGLISGCKSNGCLTQTTSPFQPLPYNQITSGNGEHQFMLWFWVNNVPESTSGISYTLSYTITKTSGPGPNPGSFPSPFAYSGNGNDQHNYVLADNTAGCPGTVPNPTGNGSNLSGIAKVTLTGSPSTRKDILWQLHLNWPSSSGHLTGNTVYKFTGTVTDSLGNTKSSSINITVTP
jgi:hypothetical protein